MLQDAGGVEGGQPKGPEVNTHHTAANIWKCWLHSQNAIAKQEGRWYWIGWAGSQMVTFTTERMGTAQGGECS